MVATKAIWPQRRLGHKAIWPLRQFGDRTRRSYLELDSEEVTKTKDDERVSNSIRGQGNTALYEPTDKRIKLGTSTVAPRPYLYYGVSKGSSVQYNRGAWATYESEL